MLNAKIYSASWFHKYFIGVIISLSLYMYLPGITTPFLTTGEPREALVAQTMFLENNMLKSERYDHELATKPPLLHWTIVLISKLGGEVNEATSRMPSVLSAISIMCVWTLFLASRFGISIAILSFLILGTSFEWLRHASLSRVDMLLAANVSFTLILLYKWVREIKLRYLLLAIFFMSLAVLTKGPIGIILPCMITGISLLYWRQLNVKNVLLLASAASIAIFPLMFWYYAEYLSMGKEFLDIVISENVLRFLGKMEVEHKAHTHGSLYLFGVLLLGTLPWSFFIIPTLPGILVKLKNKYHKNIECKCERRYFIEWSIICIVTCFCFFLVPSSKRGVYLLPIYPQIALLLSLCLHQNAENKESVANRITSSLILFFFFLLSLLCLLQSPLIKDLELNINEVLSQRYLFFFNLATHLSDNFSLGNFLIFTFTFAALGILLFVNKKSRNRFHTLGLTFALMIPFAKSDILFPVLNNFSPKPFIELEIDHHQPRELGFVSDRMYAEVFYTRKYDKDIQVRHGENSKKVFFWEDGEQNSRSFLYEHVSPQYIRKYGRHLKYAELGD